MNRNQNYTNKNSQSPIPGCLGRMVNLFDLNTSLGGNRLLTEKPHYQGSPMSRSQSDVSWSRGVDDRIHDKVMVSELGKSASNKKANMTPIKMLIAQEMLKEEAPKQNSPNLVAKLMGLDDLPQQHQPGAASCRSNSRRSRSRSHSGSLEFIPKEHDEGNQYEDVFEIWQQSCRTYDVSPRKGRKCKESKNEKNLAFVREKFIEAKRLSTDEKLRQSKQFQDALEVLSSNKDLFLQLLQEPNSLFSQHQNLPSVVPPQDSKCITVLKPSKLSDAHKLPSSGKNNGKQMNGIVWDKYNGNPNKPSQPTRIVVLKPSTGKPHEMKAFSSPPSSLKTLNEDGFYGDLEGSEAKESICGLPESPSGHRRDETLLSSVFSTGYVGDESSFSKSEVYYASGNLSDSEVMSPTSRQSWDYVNRFGSPYSSSSFSHASYSPESSVCREAKKRLSERWALMSLNGNVQEQRHVRRSSSTLGEMLALSDIKKSVESEENCKNTRDTIKNKGQDADIDSGPKNLTRSKSLPASSTEFLKSKKDDTKELTKEKSLKSSLFKGKVSSLFFSKSRKSSKQKSEKIDDDVNQSSRNIGNDGSQCVSDLTVKGVDAELAAQRLSEGGFSGNANENQDQPSPVSVLELQFEDDDHTSGSSCTAKLNGHGRDPSKGNLIDKSPLIGSIARTLSWDDSDVETVSPVLGKMSTKPMSPEEEEQECLLYVQTLLSAAGIVGDVESNSVIARWHSPESPLDPSLRDKYMNQIDNVVDQSKQRHQRSFQKLVFDAVNEALQGRTRKDKGMLAIDHVWGQMKEWLSGDGRCVWDGDEEDGGGTTTHLAVEWVVRKEVVGQVWTEHLRLQIDDINKEIEEKLVDQVVEEVVLELTGRVILAYTP
ncbi:hypothetical protein M8C21_011593 [Ambrosia artemisiifolia]|uniref:Uncharacterized protein n=1 Tax=Ambrosia artemisiifolia TaxID=4212 RepID=A0AAD5GRR8_AMBAR|nr:hypothetical protein M8C21_011593 [Ambrosia artemisiifolia]